MYFVSIMINVTRIYWSSNKWQDEVDSKIEKTVQGEMNEDGKGIKEDGKEMKGGK